MAHMFFLSGVHTGTYMHYGLETGNRTRVPFVVTTDDRDYTEWEKMDWINLLQGSARDQAYDLIFKNLIYTENEDDPDLPGPVPETEEE